MHSFDFFFKMTRHLGRKQTEQKEEEGIELLKPKRCKKSDFSRIKNKNFLSCAGQK